LHTKLHRGQASGKLHERIETSIKQSIEGAYRVGQLAAMPRLVNQAVTPAGTSPMPAPGQPGFDPWCLTDPATRLAWQRDPAARRAIEVLWANDPDTGRTLGIQAEIDGAERRGDIGRSAQGNFYCCPWSAIYQAVNPVTIGGTRLRRGETFTFDVSAEELGEGGSFKREILVANFAPTREIDYCNPDEGGGG
jgi:hypothetical protein